MRKKSILFTVMIVVLAVSCTTKAPLRKGEVLLEDKGTAYGFKTPQWVELAVVGSYRDIEKLSDYKDKTVFIAQFEAQNLQSAQLLAERMQADTEIARYLSTRVKMPLRAQMSPMPIRKTSAPMVSASSRASVRPRSRDSEWRPTGG